MESIRSANRSGYNVMPHVSMPGACVTVLPYFWPVDLEIDNVGHKGSSRDKHPVIAWSEDGSVTRRLAHGGQSFGLEDKAAMRRS